MEKSKLIAGIAGIGVVVGGICALIGNDVMFGSRGKYDVERFSYHGVPVVIEGEDVRFGLDRYFLQIDGKDIIKEGSLTGDNGKVYGVLDDGRRYFVSGK